jgi:hypothetical protein
MTFAVYFVTIKQKKKIENPSNHPAYLNPSGNAKIPIPIGRVF